MMVFVPRALHVVPHVCCVWSPKMWLTLSIGTHEPAAFSPLPLYQVWSCACISEPRLGTLPEQAF